MQLNEAHEAQQKRTHDIVADMTRQYKSTEDELNMQHSRLEQRIDQNDDIIANLKKEFEDISAAKANLHEEKKVEMAQLHTYINNMNQNFSAMLKTTLTKMKERIAQAN